MSIGIEVILRATTTGFTKGIATANRSLESLKKNLKHGDVGNGLKQLLGAGAIIAGLRSVINHAQEARDNFEKMGMPIPDATQRVAALGDAVEGLGRKLREIGATGLSWVTAWGEKLGEFEKFKMRIFGVGGPQIDSKLGGQIERDADKRVAALEEARRKAVENGRKVEEQIAAIKEERANARLIDEERINKMLNEQIILRQNLAGVSKNPVASKEQVGIAELKVQQKGLEIDKATKAFDEKKKSLDKRMADAMKSKQDAQQAVVDAQRDQFLPTIEGLAASQDFSHGEKQNKAIMTAREIVNLQRQAADFSASGRIGDAVDVQSRANAMRQGLSGFVKSDEANRGRDLTESVDKTTKAVEEVRDAIKDVYVVKK